MSIRVATGRILGALTALLVTSALAIGCGSNEDEGAAGPDSELTLEQATAPLEGAPPELAAIRQEANQLLPGGTEAFDARLADLHGTPLVVNKWASWCGPCRFEFPLFQSQAIEREQEIAFLGLDSDDSEDAARTFLARCRCRTPATPTPTKRSPSR